MNGQHHFDFLIWIEDHQVLLESSLIVMSEYHYPGRQKSACEHCRDFGRCRMTVSIPDWHPKALKIRKSKTLRFSRRLIFSQIT